MEIQPTGGTGQAWEVEIQQGMQPSVLVNPHAKLSGNIKPLCCCDVKDVILEEGSL